MRLIALLLLLLPATAMAAEWVGTVVGVADGDTITVLNQDQRTERIRLSDIDAPESGQAFGSRAKQALSDLVYRQRVRAVEVDRDRYGRLVARVYVGELDVNAELVRTGMAWVYRQYSRDAALLTLEAEARAAKRGLWADASPVPPWEYRRPKPAQNV